MGKRIYKPARLRVLVWLLIAAVIVCAGIVCALRARMLLRSTLDGRRERAEAETYISEFALRAQMNRRQADAKVNGFMTMAGYREVFLSIGEEERFARCFDPIGTDHIAPWVLLLHGGLGSDGTDLLDMVCELSISGFRVLLPDLRAHGRSEGNTASLGIQESLDVSAWIAWIRMREPNARILVFGQDEGAAAALLALESMKGSVSAVAVDSAYSDLHGRAAALFEERHSDQSSLDKKLFDLAFDAAFAGKGRQNSLLEAVRECEMPLLLIHGTGDEDVPAWHSEDLAKAAGANAEICLIEGASNGIARFVDPKTYYDCLLRFFKAAI